MDFLAVGQGDAIFIRSPTGKTVLIDGGPPNHAETLSRLVRARTNVPLDLIVLTHRHIDHLGGLARIVDDQGARLFMDATFPHDTPAYLTLLHSLERHHIPVRNAIQGRSIDLGGGAHLILLTPIAPPLSGTRSDVNSNSLVIRLDHGGVHMLLAGDAEKETESWLLLSHRDKPNELRADLLKVAHHGSRYASSIEFLQAVTPRFAIISCGWKNEYHHPHADTLQRLQWVGARIFRTDLDGTVSATSDGSALVVESEMGSGARLETQR